MKKLSLLLIVLCSYSSFAQLEGVPVSRIILTKNKFIEGEENAITVPNGKVWLKIQINSSLKIRDNDGESYSNYSNVFLPEGFKVYYQFTGTNGDANSQENRFFEAVEYNLSAQQLSHAAPKIDNRPTLFPNPTNSMLSLNSDKNYKIQVFDLNGRKLMEQNGNSLNMEHLSNATYVVKAMDVDTKEMLSYKVVKE